MQVRQRKHAIIANLAFMLKRSGRNLRNGVVPKTVWAAGPYAEKKQDPAAAVIEIKAADVYQVTRSKDGVVIAAGVTLTEAEELVAKAIKQKKAKLEYTKTGMNWVTV